MANSGFTLLEMMVVVAVLSVMTALAVGGLEPTVRRLQAADAAEQVQDALAFARANARASGRCTRVDLITPAPPTSDSVRPQLAANATGTVLRIWRWKALDCAGAVSDSPLPAQMIQEVPLPDGFGAKLNAAELEFLGNGLPQSAGATFTVDALTQLGTPASPSGHVVQVSAMGRTCEFPAASPGVCP